jgi:hypothetical protein
MPPHWSRRGTSLRTVTLSARAGAGAAASASARADKRAADDGILSLYLCREDSEVKWSKERVIWSTTRIFVSESKCAADNRPLNP